jgi:hypothetical protein
MISIRFEVENKLTHLFAAQHHIRQLRGINSALAIVFLADYRISFYVRPEHVVADKRIVSCDVHALYHNSKRQCESSNGDVNGQ